MQLFPTQAINELAQEFKLLRKDIQAMRHSLTRLEQKLVDNLQPTPPFQPTPPSTKPTSNLFKNQKQN
jgi:hypothetical protein